jgi:hypothetical protein
MCALPEGRLYECSRCGRLREAAFAPVCSFCWSPEESTGHRLAMEHVARSGGHREDLHEGEIACERCGAPMVYRGQCKYTCSRPCGYTMSCSEGA